MKFAAGFPVSPYSRAARDGVASASATDNRFAADVRRHGLQRWGKMHDGRRVVPRFFYQSCKDCPKTWGASEMPPAHLSDRPSFNRKAAPWKVCPEKTPIAEN